MTSEPTNPLRELDAVDWASLDHAYGPAEDVPGLLRDLCATDPDARGAALHTLYGNIFHQGSRYPATVAAVPFLVGLAAEPSTPDRAELLELLAALAIGYDEAHLPHGVDVAGWRSGVAEFAAADPEAILAEYGVWVAEAADDGERRVRESRRSMFDYDQQLAFAQAELSAYDAVRQGVPALRALLADSEPAVRAATAYLLAWFPEEAPHTLPALLALAEREWERECEREREPAVLATALVAIGLLGDPATAERLTPHLAAEQPVVRWAAATALTRVARETADEACVGAMFDALDATVKNPPAPGPIAVPFHGGSLRGYAATSLMLLAERLPLRALDAVLESLAATGGPDSFVPTATALRLAFGGERLDPLPEFTALTSQQQRLVTTLADFGADTWRWVNFTGILRDWGLPQTRAGMRAYAGLAGPAATPAPGTDAPEVAAQA